MTKNQVYTITEDDFEDIYKKIKTINLSLEVLYYFCKNSHPSEDFYKINPIMNFILKESDLLHANFINKLN